jgi:hypothetical protein
MVTMGRAGLQAECSSALAPGMAGAAVGVAAGAVVGATAVRAGVTVEATTADVGSWVDADTRAAIVAAQDFTARRVVDSTAEAGSTVAQVAAFTVEAAMLVAVDTGNRSRF